MSKTNSKLEFHGTNDPNRFHTLNTNVNITALNDLKEKMQFDLTKQDYIFTEIKDKLLLDHRSFCKYYWDNLQDSSEIIAFIFKRTLLKPYYLSVTEFLHKFNLTLALNALFMSDDLINQNNKSLFEGTIVIYITLIFTINV